MSLSQLGLLESQTDETLLRVQKSKHAVTWTRPLPRVLSHRRSNKEIHFLQKGAIFRLNPFGRRPSKFM